LIIKVIKMVETYLIELFVEILEGREGEKREETREREREKERELHPVSTY